MIHINLLLPLCGDTLEIPCEEEMLSDTLMERILDLLPKENQGVFRGKSWLCHVDRRKILTHQTSLGENGVVEGSNLILI